MTLSFPVGVLGETVIFVVMVSGAMLPRLPGPARPKSSSLLSLLFTLRSPVPSLLLAFARSGDRLFFFTYRERDEVENSLRKRLVPKKESPESLNWKSS